MPLEVADRPKDVGPPKKKREPLVPIPADAPKMPILKDMKDQIDVIYTEIKGYKTTIEELRNAAEERRKTESDPRQAIIQEKKTLLDEKKNISVAITQLRAERNAIQNQVNAIRQAARDQERDIRAMNKELGNLLTIQDIDAKIKALEFKIESGGGTVKGEKLIIKEIRQLQAAREKAAQMGQKAVEVVDQRTQEEKLSDEAKAKQREIDSKSAEMTIILRKLDDKQSEMNAFSGATEAKKSREERDAVSEKITKGYARIDAIRADFDAKKKLYEEWKVGYDKACQEKRDKLRKEREEMDNKRAADRQEHELQIAALKRLNPYEEEIANAESLIGYLKAKIAFQARDERKTAEKNSAAAHFDPMAAAGKGMTVMKKSEDDDWLFGNTKTKKAAANKPKPKPVAKPADAPVKSKPMSHNSEKLTAFESMGVQVPKNTAEVKSTIEELQKKKDHWSTFILTKKEAMEQEKAEREKKEAAAAAAAAAKAVEDEE